MQHARDSYNSFQVHCHQQSTPNKNHKIVSKICNTNFPLHSSISRFQLAIDIWTWNRRQPAIRTLLRNLYVEYSTHYVLAHTYIWQWNEMKKLSKYHSQGNSPDAFGMKPSADIFSSLKHTWIPANALFTNRTYLYSLHREQKNWTKIFKRSEVAE